MFLCVVCVCRDVCACVSCKCVCVHVSVLCMCVWDVCHVSGDQLCVV